MSEVGSITSITGDSHLTNFDGPGDDLKLTVLLINVRYLMKNFYVKFKSALKQTI